MTPGPKERAGPAGIGRLRRIPARIRCAVRCQYSVVGSAGSPHRRSSRRWSVMTASTGDPLETAQQERADRPHAVPWRAVVVFVVLAFGLAWLIALPMWLAPGVSTAALMMLAPALRSAEHTSEPHSLGHLVR